MGPAILVENILSEMQFPLHTVAADEQATGFEVYHLANGRRAVNDRYQSVTANQARIITATCDRLRYLNGFALDRGHNLGGVALSVLGSSDGWTTSQTVWTGTVPALCTPPGQLDAANGVTTEEGAFVVRFTGASYMAWRLSIPALGAGIVPQIVGAWLGLWYAPGFFMEPWGEDQADVVMAEQQSDIGWTGSTVPVPRRAGAMTIKLRSFADYDLARYHIAGHFLAQRRPAWLLYDDQQAERAVLALRQPGVQGFEIDTGWAFRQAKVAWREHEPRLPGG